MQVLLWLNTLEEGEISIELSEGPSPPFVELEVTL
jgi:hypothetical protein